MAYSKQISKVFSPEGALSAHIKGFRPRAEQVDMATAVGNAIERQGALVVEAGTGTGAGVIGEKQNHHIHRFQKLPRSAV